MLIHIIPLNDFKEHQESESCWCNPTLTEGLDNCYTHNPADGRNFLEDLILVRQDVYLHFARVAALWFDTVATFFSYANDDTAILWLNRRKEHIISLDSNADWKVMAFKQYTENVMLGFGTTEEEGVDNA
jgi:hypothetical protein